METPPNSEGGASRGEVSGTGGGTTNVNESFHKIPEPPMHELLLLLRVEQLDGRPLAVGTYTDRCVNLQYKSIRYRGGVSCRCSNRSCGTTAPHDTRVGRGSCDCVMHHGKKRVYHGGMPSEIDPN